MRASTLRSLSILASTALAGACGTASSPENFEPLLALASCEGCHTDYQALQDLHTPDSVMPVEGCSGPPPYVAPYDRVFLSEAGFADFKASSHGEQDCTTCHGGVDGTADKATAHSNSFVRHPSFEAIEVCADCHGAMVGDFENSLHLNGWGQKNSQIRRAGVSSFEDLHEGIREGYEKNCTTCHASCGSCHVNRPPAGGGGLLNGHAFAAPDMRDNCTQCHSSRGGHAYFGVGPGTRPDLHLTQADFTCTDCHSVGEMHGDGGALYEQRYEVEGLPSCRDCHADIDGANPYHSRHLDDFNCQTCHSQDYNTCGSCHVGGEGARIHAHLEFKIGLNPIPDERPYEFATLRRTLAAPDSWSMYGVDRLESFDDKSLYNYTTPHNIQLWTSRTQVEDGKPCSDSCHIIKEGDSYRNRHLYLLSSDFLEDWERAAAQSVVVDGHLPVSWGN